MKSFIFGSAAFLRLRHSDLSGFELGLLVELNKTCEDVSRLCETVTDISYCCLVFHKLTNQENDLNSSTVKMKQNQTWNPSKEKFGWESNVILQLITVFLCWNWKHHSDKQAVSAKTGATKTCKSVLICALKWSKYNGGVERTSVCDRKQPSAGAAALL